eukprot:TRINITY_DN72865_c0_g1_i1.p1 TRINITY_DN72865_c0_g1~~TRINITY_DN72865_c0_g1_i1.p1  ORF type:complete len:130 (-),score=38.72 TRINITY_DN72865_c0_g1_i1:58-447(-)
MAMAMPAPLGAEAMAAMDAVAERMNYGLFSRASDGAAVRIAGRLGTESGALRLTATDGGSVGVEGISIGEEEKALLGGFVEVVGTKSGNTVLSAKGVVPLGDSVDPELWDEATKMMHEPKLAEFLKPVA